MRYILKQDSRPVVLLLYLFTSYIVLLINCIANFSFCGDTIPHDSLDENSFPLTILQKQSCQVGYCHNCEIPALNNCTSFMQSSLKQHKLIAWTILCTISCAQRTPNNMRIHDVLLYNVLCYMKINTSKFHGTLILAMNN